MAGVITPVCARARTGRGIAVIAVIAHISSDNNHSEVRGGNNNGMRTAIDPPLDPDRYGFGHRLRVRFAETDAMGIVHHSRYLPYLEEGRVEYLRSIGHPYDELRSTGVDLAVLEVFVAYRAPLRFDELVDVHVMLANATRTTLQMAYLLGVDGEPRATAVTVHGAVNTETGRPRRLPDWIHRLVDEPGR
jgi:acyl-CoA thioester hydrolase